MRSEFDVEVLATHNVTGETRNAQLKMVECSKLNKKVLADNNLQQPNPSLSDDISVDASSTSTRTNDQKVINRNRNQLF